MACPGVLFVSLMIMMVVVLFLHKTVYGAGILDWASPDRFDEVDGRFRAVSSGTCRSRSKAQMVMREDVVSQLPVYNQMLSRTWYRNRTALIHVHNMALNRAFFYSYVLQKQNDSASYKKQPNYLYYYLSAAADVNSNPNMLNGSAVYFDNNCCYPNWYITVPFNRTLGLFAPKATRWDDYQDQDNLLREPTRTVVAVKDAAAGLFSNYTHPGYKMNTWYKTWLPDLTEGSDSLTKFTYLVGIKRSVKTGQFLTKGYQSFSFFGPPSPGATEKDPRMLPVQWTAPYFDCGGSNKWVVSAVSPIVDFMPRYSNYTHLRRQRVVALSVMDIDLNQVDFNACGVSAGNPGPSYLSGVHRCKKTTSCKHVAGYGLKRGGYKCVCKAGTKYPWSVEPAFMGVDIEQSTLSEYKGGFQCEPTNQALVLPVIDNYHTTLDDDDLSFIGHDNLLAAKINETRKRRSNTNCQSRNTSSGSSFKHQNMTADNLDLPETDVETARQVEHSGPGQETVTDCQEGGQHGATLGVSDRNDLAPREETSDHYVNRNRVDSAIEEHYQEDLQRHRSRFAASNLTEPLAKEAHRESLLKLRDRHIERFYKNKAAPGTRGRKKRFVFDEASHDRVKRILRQKAKVTASNCKQLPAHLLQLPGDVGYGVEKQFEPEGRTALRLSHFLSVYLQNAQPDTTVGSVKGGGLLQEEHLLGEVLANVMANNRILSAGIFFDRFKFIQQGPAARELFGPRAFRKDGAYYVIDSAGLASQYVDEDWFLRAKAMFNGNFVGLDHYKIRAHVRSNPKGVSSIRFGFFPLTYRAASYKLGHWTRPHFRCDGNVDAWVMTYVSPFFGLDSLGAGLQFRGVTTVDVPLDLLEINQCPQPFTTANAFKNTARCDYFSTKCSPLAGFPFSRGSYMCSCRLGFEYWHADGKEWFEGSFIELEYLKKKAGVFSRFDQLYCRPSSASLASSRSFMFTFFGALFLLLR